MDSRRMIATGRIHKGYATYRFETYNLHEGNRMSVNAPFWQVWSFIKNFI
jgi:hypothetical protein